MRAVRDVIHAAVKQLFGPGKDEWPDPELMLAATLYATSLYEWVHGNVGGPAEWRVGITANPEDRRVAHRADFPHMRYFMYDICETEELARLTERILLKAGLQGGEGGGKDDAPPTCVYVFKER